MSTFSKRFGHLVPEKPITTRDEAPQGLRDFIVQTMYHLGFNSAELREITCRVLRIAPDMNNWSPGNVEQEVYQVIHNVEWFQVYDLIETYYQSLPHKIRPQYEEDINGYFGQSGIGWKLSNGLLEVRGDRTFETAIAKVEATLHEVGLADSEREIREAIRDLSRRPEPDITGAIQHSLACLECVTREVLGDPKATLGELMKKAGGVIPPPLDSAISKIWGFTSEQGRHLKEGNPPQFSEAELVVELSAVLSSYLGKKLKKKSPPPDDGLPF